MFPPAGPVCVCLLLLARQHENPLPFRPQMVRNGRYLQPRTIAPDAARWCWSFWREMALSPFFVRRELRK